MYILWHVNFFDTSVFKKSDRLIIELKWLVMMLLIAQDMVAFFLNYTTYKHWNKQFPMALELS